jgi:hypothetical protein
MTNLLTKILQIYAPGLTRSAPLPFRTVQRYQLDPIVGRQECVTLCSKGEKHDLDRAGSL